MKRLPQLFTAIALGGGCSPQAVAPDAGPVQDAGTPEDAGYDAGMPDAGARDAGTGTPFGDAGCVLPSDFPWDSGEADTIAMAACECKTTPELFHCFEEGGPRCFSWACPPAADTDGGYVYQPDGGLVCLC